MAVGEEPGDLDGELDELEAELRSSSLAIVESVEARWLNLS